jgi:hypothetical protein
VIGLRLVLVSVMSTAATAISPATTVKSTARMSAGIVMVVSAIAAGVMMLARAIAGRVATAAEHPPRSRVAAVAACVTAAAATRPLFHEEDKEPHKGGKPENGQKENQEGRHGGDGVKGRRRTARNSVHEAGKVERLCGRGETLAGVTWERGRKIVRVHPGGRALAFSSRQRARRSAILASHATGLGV